MGIKFYNIRTGESRLCTTEPMIAAFWGSSDRGPNVSQGQDFGWRLSPETVAEVDRIRQDDSTLQKIALTYSLPLETVTEPYILKYISSRDDDQGGAEKTEKDFQAAYEEEIRKLKQAEKDAKLKKESAEADKNTTTSSAKADSTTKDKKGSK